MPKTPEQKAAEKEAKKLAEAGVLGAASETTTKVETPVVATNTPAPTPTPTPTAKKVVSKKTIYGGNIEKEVVLENGNIDITTENGVRYIISPDEYKELVK